MAFTVEANFIDVFKIGDNINYNLGILRVLYREYDNSPDGVRLIKPIVILNTSIAEAILYDFIENRIRKANRTEILYSEIAALLSGKKLDKFSHYIVQAEKHDFFDLKDTNFYNAMRTLAGKRNRIHIQNSMRKEPENESEVFDIRAKKLSEKVLEKILNTMNSKYPRRAEYHGFVSDFELPWDRHFPV